MIKQLHIQNYVIIEDLEINFSKGLTIITGETGAGKSILLGALGLIMGKRAETKTLYNKNQKCIIEASFDIEKYNLAPFFEQQDLDYENELIIRRELTPSGKSRAFVNDTPVKLAVLQQLNSALIDLHRQFDTLDIHNESFQLKMLDALANNKKLLKEYRVTFRKYKSIRKALKNLEEKNKIANREQSFVNFQLQELEQQNLESGRQASFEKDLNQLNNSEEIKTVLRGVEQIILKDDNALIENINVLLEQLTNISGSLSSAILLKERLQSVKIELEDIAGESEKISSNIEYDYKKIEFMTKELDGIYKLLNKYNLKTDVELVELYESLKGQSFEFDELEQKIKETKRDLDDKYSYLYELGEKISNNRKAIVSDFQKKVLKLLTLLSMENSKFLVSFEKLEKLDSTGIDHVEYLFSANKGAEPLPIKDVASGGELSRLTLCTKSLVASAIPLPTLIFDEIDSGVSGAVAMQMGRILSRLSDKHQVLCITHSPQIAAKGNMHYLVYKKDNETRTTTNMMELNKEQKVREIAIMLSTNPPTQSALNNARELLDAN